MQGHPKQMCPSKRLSLVTNVSVADFEIIQHTVPSWLRVLGDQVVDLLLVVDPKPLTGRIARLHGTHATESNIISEVRRLTHIDSRIRWLLLPNPTRLTAVSEKWFGSSPKVPVRCQAGTPIIAFVLSIEEALSDIILRVDCDMLLHESGWLQESVQLLESSRAALVEPSRLESISTAVSTRALLLKKSTLAATCLPLKTQRLDWKRRIHRRLNGRSTWLALEQMLTNECQSGVLQHTVLGSELGFSLHLGDRSITDNRMLPAIIKQVEGGALPIGQQQRHDLNLNAWI